MNTNFHELTFIYFSLFVTIRVNWWLNSYQIVPHNYPNRPVM